MRDDRANEFVPARGKLPAALEIFPAHLVQFKLGESYTQEQRSTYGQNDYSAGSLSSATSIPTRRSRTSAGPSSGLRPPTIDT